MTITLNLAPKSEAYLRAKAAREGQGAEVVAHALLMQAIRSGAQSQQGILLQDYGIDAVQAAELRDSLASFAGEWNQPGMDIYDDYDAAKALIHLT